MFVLAIALTVALLLETVPSAIAGLSRLRAGMTRLDQLTRIGLMQGRNLRVVPLLGAVHLAYSLFFSLALALLIVDAIR